MKYELVSQRKKVEDELNKREEYHMPDQEPGQTMSKKYELLTARYRFVTCPAHVKKLARVTFPVNLNRDDSLGVMMQMDAQSSSGLCQQCSQ